MNEFQVRWFSNHNRAVLMDQSEYIDFLWKIIGVEGLIIAALAAAVWHHVLEDRKVRIELQRCKDALGLNGPKS